MRVFIAIILLIGMIMTIRIFCVTPGSNPGVWTRYGTVMTGDPSTEETAVAEPRIIYEGSPVILAGPNVYKMWYTAGWSTPKVNYAESADGKTWTKYTSNPLLTNPLHAEVMHDGATYYLWAVRSSADQKNIDLYTATDGVTFALDTSAILTTGGAGTWDANRFGNIYIWKEGTGDYRMLYEASNAADLWKIGYATSTDMRTWTKYGSNPVVSEGGMVGGPFLWKAGAGDYWLWTHRSSNIGKNTPLDFARYHSTDFTTWTRSPYQNVYHRLGTDEGANNRYGSIGDVWLIQVGSQTYMWYDASPDGEANPGQPTIKLAIANLTLAQLVETNEGP